MAMLKSFLKKKSLKDVYILQFDLFDLETMCGHTLNRLSNHSVSSLIHN